MSSLRLDNETSNEKGKKTMHADEGEKKKRIDADVVKEEETKKKDTEERGFGFYENEPRYGYDRYEDRYERHLGYERHLDDLPGPADDLPGPAYDMRTNHNGMRGSNSRQPETGGVRYIQERMHHDLDRRYDRGDNRRDENRRDDRRDNRRDDRHNRRDA